MAPAGTGFAAVGRADENGRQNCAGPCREMRKSDALPREIGRASGSGRECSLELDGATASSDASSWWRRRVAEGESGASLGPFFASAPERILKAAASKPSFSSTGRPTGPAQPGAGQALVAGSCCATGLRQDLKRGEPWTSWAGRPWFPFPSLGCSLDKSGRNHA
jgi:hypothetical protein